MKDLPLEPGEEEIEPSEELLFRQITVHLMNNGKPSTSSFGPATSDKGKPSFSRESVVSAKDAQTWHNQHAKSESLGVWSVSVDEAASTGLRTIDDSAVPPAPWSQKAPGHCYVDYRAMEKRAERECRAVLLRFALKRGQVPTGDDEEPTA
ncbi:hypothetical protein FYJ24_09295 [Actinomycetaceae bacterium WB03_NA08]|uniref:Uncharacterized protein n=1 Tax=Scrofimicrobium canadense TaxID=2652290 RepID=A0A6N7W8Y8_9ACTO|nr:hypothetical protein [Scrofimicrobium canadense]MSS84953.1 hypothetical protein [Scrofimicrobium canadense]